MLGLVTIVVDYIISMWFLLFVSFVFVLLPFLLLSLSYQGVIYLHESPIRFHGSLCTSNLLIDSRWVVKLSDFGLFAFKKGIEDNSTDVVAMAAKCTSKLKVKKYKKYSRNKKKTNNKIALGARNGWGKKITKI